MGTVLTNSDWYSALGNTEYADYLMAARDRFLQHEAATTRQVKAVYTRVAKQLKYEIQQVAPGTLRAGHLTALAKKLEQAADTLNREMLNAVYAGIKLAVQDATDGTEQITLDVLKDVFDQSAVRAMFASINEQAVLAVLSRTRHDGLKVSDRIWRVSQNARTALTKVVEDGVARGLNSRVLARRVQQYMQPDVWTDLKEETRQNLKVPRNISMEAMRLAVTELHHAFHEGAVQSYRATPSYQGVYWRLSASHPHTDICDSYASHGGNGFWEAGNEPTKPHPWCRCVIVPRLEDTDQFVRRLRQWAENPQSQPDIENWYSGVREWLPRPRRTTIVPLFPAAPSRTFADSVRERIARGVNTDRDVIEVGDMLRGELQRRVGDLEREVQQILARKDEITAQMDRNRRNGALQDNERLLVEYETLENRRRQLMSQLRDRKELVRGVLGEIRSLGSNESQQWAPRSSSVVKQAVAAVSRYLPTDWLRVSHRSPMVGRLVQRGYYRPPSSPNEPAEIALSGRHLEAVAIHEMGHRMESLLPGIRDMEEQFYKRRTAGEQLRWLGPGYGRNELTRVDKWVNPYIGKDYGGWFFEILSMGLEAVFYETYDLSADPEFEAFILGVLASV